MIKHIVLLKWKQGVSRDQVDRVTAGLSALKSELSELVSYEFGEDLGIYRGNADYALIAEFRNEAALKAYVSHPSHQALMSEVTGPIMDVFQSVQFQSGEGDDDA